MDQVGVLTDEKQEQLAIEHAEKQRRLRIVSITVPAVLGVLILLVLPLFEFLYDFYQIRLAVIGVAILMLLYSGASIVMAYLQTGFRGSLLSAEAAYLEGYSIVANRSKAKTGFAEEHGRTAEERDEWAKLVGMLEERITDQANAQVLAELEAKVAKTYPEEKFGRELQEAFSESRSRLLFEIEALTRRSNLNLTIGVITTLTGLILLGYFVYTSKVSDVEPWKFAMHYLPRLALVLFLEVFAYFFLQLYKSGLGEMKYFQNELTNIEAKQIALTAAAKLANAKSASEVISKLASTERNHILSKGQTTVELERARLERESVGDALKHFAAVVPGRRVGRKLQQ